MFSKAQRKKAKLRLGICGASGSGKTWSALEIATGMGGKIAMIDTEGGRGELYGEDFEYDVMQLVAPYSPENYINAIKNAEKNGYDTLIIDSLSHAWVGDGGILSIVDRAGSKSFSEGWKTASPKHNALVDSIITSKLHIIVTMRTKTEYVVELNAQGKNVPRKIGTTPVQRDGLEYEFTVFMDMSQDNIAHITKDNTKLFNQQYIKPTNEMGKKLMDWLNSGIDPEVEFSEKTLPSIINQINSCADLAELQNVFQKNKPLYADRYPEYFMKVIEAKDMMKSKFQSIGV